MFLLELAVLVITLLAAAYSLRSWWMASELPPETTSDGSYLLRYSKNTLWLGMIAIAAGAILLGSAYVLRESIETAISLIMMGGGLIIGGMWLSGEYFNNRVIVNDRYIRKRSWLGSDMIIDWARLEKVKFSSRSGTFVLIDTNGDKIKVSRLMRGFQKFEEILNRQAPREKVDQNSMEDYEKLQELEKELIEEFRKSSRQEDGDRKNETPETKEYKSHLRNL